MKTSTQGVKQIADREDVRTHAYRDTKGIWTIGIGHTSMAGPPSVHDGLTLTLPEVYTLFAKDLTPVESCVNHAIQVMITQNQFDALVSICYNIGNGAFSKSSMVRDINSRKDIQTIDADIMKWDMPKEIISRRQSEEKEFNS